MNPIQFALRVLRADRRTRISTLLTAVGVAVATALVLVLASLPSAAKLRAQREAWQQPLYTRVATSAPAMLMATNTDFTGNDQISVVTVASIADPATIRLPTGVQRFPRPGEVEVSPALLDRMHALPAAQLADRYPGRVVGTIGDSALEYPGQLIVLVGSSPDRMPSSATPLNSLADDEDAFVDASLKLLTGVGLVVLLVPSLALIASSSRLTAASRERRLAALRLAGATPGQVTGMVVGETGIAAVVGAVMGSAVSPLLDRLAANLPWDGGPWWPSDVGLSAAATVLIATALVALVVLAGVLGLRRVVNNPIGAINTHTPKPLRPWRLLAVPLALAFFFYGVSASETSEAPLLLGLVLVVWSVLLAGPWLTFAVGSIFMRSWQRPSTLLAGRRLREDPNGSYRASVGVVLAVFVGAMALTLLPSFASLAADPASDDSAIEVHAINTDIGDQLARIDGELARYHLPERGVVTGRSITVQTQPADREVVWTALDRAGSGQVELFSRREYLAHQEEQVADLRHTAVVGLLAASLLAGCGVAISTTGSVLDRRRTFGALMAAGTPVGILSRALQAEAASPTLVATIGSTVSGVVVGLGLFDVATRGRQTAGAVFTPWLVAPIGVGLLVTVLAALVCTPALKRVQAEPLSDE